MEEALSSIFTLNHTIPVGGQAVHVEELAAALRRFSASLPSDHDRFFLAERLSMSVHPEMKASEFGRIWLSDRAFFEAYRRLMDANNWHSADRKYAMVQFARWATAVRGDFAECGVHKGASARMLCEVAAASGRHVHLFDSFEGLSHPGDRDGTYWAPGRLSCDQPTVEANLSGLSCFTCHKGWIPERFVALDGARFAFVHIDVDLHDPTRDSLEFFYSRLSPGGVIVLDDHGFSTCPGARRAALDFAAKVGETIVDLPTGQGLIIRRD